MTRRVKKPVFQIKFNAGRCSIYEHDAIQIESKLRKAAGSALQVLTPRMKSKKGKANVLSEMEINAVVASLALPSLAFIAKAIRDIIINFLKARDNATVEIETPDGHKVKITGPEATSDHVLMILQELTGNALDKE